MGATASGTGAAGHCGRRGRGTENRSGAVPCCEHFSPSLPCHPPSATLAAGVCAVPATSVTVACRPQGLGLLGAEWPGTPLGRVRPFSGCGLGDASCLLGPSRPGGSALSVSAQPHSAAGCVRQSLPGARGRFSFPFRGPVPPPQQLVHVLCPVDADSWELWGGRQALEQDGGAAAPRGGTGWSCCGSPTH